MPSLTTRVLCVKSDVLWCRLAWVAGFCIGPFGGNERTWKPFNPILGETFELDLPTNGVRFLAEQVRHSHAVLPV